jgi:uncharacterized protein (TIGR03545 family)
MTRPRFKVFRWRAIGPLILFFILLGVLWTLFADTLARRQARANLEEILGTQVDLERLTIRETDVAVDLGGLAIADPRNPNRNLLEAGTITVDLDPVPLAEKKLVIDRLSLGDLRFFTQRATPARPADPNGPAARLLAETEGWAREKFQFPKLVMGRVDTARSLVLNPEQLGTVKAAQALAGRADSVKDAFEQELASLEVKSLVDSSKALATRLAALDPKKLGVGGIQSTVTSVQQTIARLERAQAALGNLEKSARSSLGALQSGLRDVDAARRRDYAFAMSLLELPSLDAPAISGALFGEPSTNYFETALAYAKVLERYVPPGLQPWKRPGPKRTRLDGTDVEFPKAEDYPRFLLRRGDVDLTFGGPVPGKLTAQAAGITSQPALVGVPATVAIDGALGDRGQIGVRLGAMLRRFGNNPKDSLAARLTGVSLPAIRFPDLPFGVDPGPSTLTASFALAGNQIAGVWAISSPRANWLVDSTRMNQASLVESTIWRVISGLTQLEVRAELGGTIESPTLNISSNLDDAIAARLRAILGEEVAKAEQKARDAVDRLVTQQVDALSGRVQGLEGEVTRRLPIEQEQLASVRKQLEGEVRRLTRGAAGGIRLPGLR